MYNVELTPFSVELTPFSVELTPFSAGGRCSLHPDGRCRLELRPGAGSAFPRRAPEGERSRSGLPSSFGGRPYPARRHAPPSSLVGQPDVLVAGEALVPRAGPRHPLRDAGIHARAVRPTRAPVHGNG